MPGSKKAAEDVIGRAVSIYEKHGKKAVLYEKKSAILTESAGHPPDNHRLVTIFFNFNGNRLKIDLIMCL